MKPEETERHKLSQADNPAHARDQRSKNSEENHLLQMDAINKKLFLEAVKVDGVLPSVC